MYEVGDIIKDVNRKLHAGGVDQTQDFYGALDEARRNMIKKCSPPELVRKAYIEEVLYDRVDKYAIPQDLKYKEVVNINLLSGYRNVEVLERPLLQVYSRKFSQKRPGARNVFSINYENGLKTMSVFNLRGMYKGTQRLIHDCNALNDNGTWNVGGNIVDLREDKLRFLTGTGSLEFDINDSDTTGFIENHTLEAVDISDFISQGAVLNVFDIPVQDIITSIKITLGSNSSDLTTDLYQFTVNRPHDGNEFYAGWNTLRFPIRDFSQVGTPNPKAITYVRFDITTTGKAMSNLHLENITAKKGTVFEVTYNSSRSFIDPVTGVWKAKATASSDRIPLEEEAYQILMLETALVIQKELYGNSMGAKSDVADIEEEVGKAYSFFREKFPSELISPSSNSYIFGDMYSGYTDQPEGDFSDLF